MLKTHFFKTSNFYKRVTTTVMGFPLLVICFFYVPVLFCLFLFTCLSLILMYEWPLLCPYTSVYSIIKTVFYPVIPFLIIIFLYFFLRFQLAVIWGYVCLFDSFCYLVGNLIGRTSITNLSPNKTWEGLIGGIMISEFLTNMLYFVFFKVSFGSKEFLFFLCMSVIAFLGDLFESWLKRKVKIKNSGTIIPGHGGLLDRFDSILFVATSYFLSYIFHSNYRL